jgi:dipeptidyl aminopeptidase/acylaminoacyl peptidase
MKHKLRLFSLILIVALVFSFTACTIPKVAIEKTTAENTIAATTAPEATVVVNTIPETTAAETAAPEATTKGKIAFYSNRDGNSEIYIMNIDGSEQVNLTNNLADDANAFFSPDGYKIVFDSNRDGNDEIYNVNFEIYIMNVDGSEQINLTNNPAFDARLPFHLTGLKLPLIPTVMETLKSTQ